MVFLACRETDSSPRVIPGGTVASFGERLISIDELDGWILSRPVSERPTPGEDLDAWYSQRVSDFAVEDALRAAARQDRLEEDPTIIAARRTVERQLTVEMCLAALHPTSETVDENALRAAYDARSETMRAPERRYVLNVFVRTGANRTAAEARQLIDELRERVLAGEPFDHVATAFSDSETRHRGGALGWLTPAQLPEQFDAVIFALLEGVPSDPVATRDGYHLFFVTEILPPHRYELDEVRPILLERLAAEQRERVLDELAQQIDIPLDAVVLDRPAFFRVLQENDQDSVVLELGDTSLTVAELHRALKRSLDQIGGTPQQPTTERAWQLLQQLTRSALILDHCQDNGLVPRAELDSRLAQWQEQAVLDLERHRKLQEIALRDEARLRLFFENNPGQFAMPGKWRLRRLRIPLDASSPTTMARLEAAVTTADSDIDALHAQLGGEVDTIGPLNHEDIARLEPKLPGLLAPLAVGELCPPYRSTDALEIVQVVARGQAQTGTFEELRARVAAAYATHYASELYRELADETLANTELTIFPEGLAALRARAGSRPEISVEQLEELLDGL